MSAVLVIDDEKQVLELLKTALTLHGYKVEVAADGREGRTIAVIAMLDDKDVEATVGALDQHVDLWIATTAQTGRSIEAGELARRIANVTSRPCLIAASVDEAMESARREAAGNDRILVTGSFYLVGPVLERLYSRPQS